MKRAKKSAAKRPVAEPGDCVRFTVTASGPNSGFPNFHEEIATGKCSDGRPFRFAKSINGDSFYLFIEGEGFRVLPTVKFVSAWLSAVEDLASKEQKE